MYEAICWSYHHLAYSAFYHSICKMGRFSKTWFIRCYITISEKEIEDGECQFFEAGKIRSVARCDLIASMLP